MGRQAMLHWEVLWGPKTSDTDPGVTSEQPDVASDSVTLSDTSEDTASSVEVVP